MGEVERHLPRVRVPALVMHSRQDHTAPVGCAERLARKLGGAVKHVALTESYHLIASDVEREQVAAEVSAFVRAAV